MRSRCLLNTPGITITVANPRLTALTSPTSFDAEVIQKAFTHKAVLEPRCLTLHLQNVQVVNVGKQQHAVSNEPGVELQVEVSGGEKPKSSSFERALDEQALESLTDKKGLARKVIHHLMPRYRLVSSAVQSSRFARPHRSLQHPTRNILVDIIEEQCFGLSGGTSGLDRVRRGRESGLDWTLYPPST